MENIEIEKLVTKFENFILERDLTLTQVGIFIGLSPSTVEKIINKKIKKPHKRTLYKIKKFIGEENWVLAKPILPSARLRSFSNGLIILPGDSWSGKSDSSGTGKECWFQRQALKNTLTIISLISVKEFDVANNLKNSSSYRFSNHLYYIFIHQKKYRVDLIAERMNIHRDSLYRWIRGDKPFPIDQLPNLVNATEDASFLDYFADQCNYTLIPKIKNRKTVEIIARMAQIMLSAIDKRENGE